MCSGTSWPHQDLHRAAGQAQTNPHRGLAEQHVGPHLPDWQVSCFSPVAPLVLYPKSCVVYARNCWSNLIPQIWPSTALPVSKSKAFLQGPFFFPEAPWWQKWLPRKGWSAALPGNPRPAEPAASWGAPPQGKSPNRTQKGRRGWEWVPQAGGSTFFTSPPFLSALPGVVSWPSSSPRPSHVAVGLLSQRRELVIFPFGL